MANPSILITGVAGQIGSQLAQHFASSGWFVFGLDLKVPSRLESISHFEVCDLACAAQVEEKITIFHDTSGAFDAVINCAGLIASAPMISYVGGRLTHHDFALWDSVISSCLSSVFHVTACTVPQMVARRKKGVVINVSSISSRGNPGQVAYSAAKAGVNGLTLSLAKELGPVGIRVVAIAPGYFHTTSTLENVASDRLKQIVGTVPLRRLGKIEELISAVDFVIANQFVNGTVIELDGGQVL